MVSARHKIFYHDSFLLLLDPDECSGPVVAAVAGNIKLYYPLNSQFTTCRHTKGRDNETAVCFKQDDVEPTR
jgi:hypothetical protein